ncbi:MAG: DUF58 domain-containing protein [Halioglobus sp.]
MHSDDPQVYTSLKALVKLRYSAHGFSYLPVQPIRSLLSGRKRSRLRGRGLDFDELRHYRPGDDIRTMDWRVTNRTGKPHVRVYTEERDRPVYIVVDQRLPMFFGSQEKMKSVIAAEVAALTAWRVLSVGDRVGCVMFNDSKQLEFSPSRGERKVMAWLGQLAAMNQSLSVGEATKSNPAALLDALHRLQSCIGHDYLIVIVSDFYGWDDKVMHALRQLREHNDIVCSLIYDPLESSIADARQLVVSDGRYQLEIDPDRHGLGDRFEERFKGSLSKVRADLKKYDIPVLPVQTVGDVTHQLREQLGGRRGLP